MTILVALLVFFVVILFHEAGHFIAAKSVGIRVNEFSVGMGPALLQKKKGETIYSLRAVPLGGYCAMEGEDEDSDDPHSFSRALPWQRFVAVLAGPLMNLVVAYLCFALFLGLSGSPIPVVAKFSENSPAKSAGLLAGDRVTAIQGRPVDDAQDMIEAIQKGKGDALEVTVLRNNESKTFRVTPARQEDGRLILGFEMERQTDLFGAIVGGLTTAVETFFSLFGILWSLISGALSIDAVSGPIGVISMIGQAAQQGISSVLYLTGYISINLAFFNLLPIPALDGFTLLFIVIEKIRGRKLRPELEERIRLIGFSLLIALILFVSFKDVLKII